MSTQYLSIPPAASFSKYIKWAEDGALVNPTGYKVTISFYDSEGYGVATFTSAGSEVVLTTGNIHISLSAAQATALATATYFEIAVTSPDGKVDYKALTGAVTQSVLDTATHSIVLNHNKGMDARTVAASGEVYPISLAAITTAAGASGLTNGRLYLIDGITLVKATSTSAYAVQASESDSAADTVTLNHDTLSMVVGGSTSVLTATVTGPIGTPSQDVTWASDDTDVVTVSAGTVTAVGAGTANVTATSVQNTASDATCVVTVTAE